jgi:uncharacterized protein YcaQ
LRQASAPRMTITLDDLRRLAVSQTLFRPTTLGKAVERLGFVQADPIRAPARAQDLTLRHRVKGYRAGDLERRYPALGIEEDVFVNYGFVSQAVHRLMHPRAERALPAARRARAGALLEFVRSRGEAHPREVDAHFAHGSVTNYWGGSSRATTHLLDDLHYRGLLRVTRRLNGTRLYAVREPAGEPDPDLSPQARVDALVDVLLRNYAPVPARTLSFLVARLRYAVPQWRRSLKAALARTKQRLPRVKLDGVDWFWTPGVDPSRATAPDGVRLLAPFDPIVWDRRRFDALWGWPYRFEAYTPVARRTLGYYALPILWRDRAIGWANVAVAYGEVTATFGYVGGTPPRGRPYRDALDAELEALRAFLEPRTRSSAAEPDP